MLDTCSTFMTCFTWIPHVSHLSPISRAIPAPELDVTHTASDWYMYFTLAVASLNVCGNASLWVCIAPRVYTTCQPPVGHLVPNPAFPGRHGIIILIHVCGGAIIAF